jgi:gamma-glutamylcyclotransferase (GGCT)/AIG2-like uncharacterized protein YtfP
MTNDEHLFVYGTLRRAAGSRMHHFLARHADFVGEGVCPGRLYRVACYPGLVAAADPTHLVQGEIYRLREPEVVLPRLDEYEGCGPGSPEPALYLRRKETVTLGQGGELLAWVYVYNRPTDGLELIVSGDFLLS